MYMFQHHIAVISRTPNSRRVFLQSMSKQDYSSGDELSAQLHTKTLDLGDPAIACRRQEGIKIEPPSGFPGSNWCLGSDRGTVPWLIDLGRARAHVEEVGKVQVGVGRLQTKSEVGSSAWCAHHRRWQWRGLGWWCGRREHMKLRVTRTSR